MLYVSEAEEKKFYMFDGDLDIALKCLVNLPYYFFFVRTHDGRGKNYFYSHFKDHGLNCRLYWKCYC